MEACLEVTDAPYVALFEDDIVAAPDWYRRSLAAIAQSELAAASSHARSGFLYLRLFYTEQFLGWNSEDWPTHALWSICTMVGWWMMLFWARSRYQTTKRLLSPRLTLVVLVTVAPLSLMLFFATGKVTLLPLHPGVSVLNNYGCCSQGLVFPRARAEQLVSWFREVRIGFVDVLIEEYANAHLGQDRLALVPPAIQHVGRKSSKATEGDNAPGSNIPVAERIWSFSFETQRQIS